MYQFEVIKCLMECIRIEVLRKRIYLDINVIFAKVKGIMGFSL